jgi:hypothetical protein
MEKSACEDGVKFTLTNQPIKQILEDLDKSLVERYHSVNRNIRNGDNKHIKLEKNRNKEVTWRLPYRRQEDAVNNLIGKYEFCKNKIAINIQEVIETVLLNSEINFGLQMQT